MKRIIHWVPRVLSITIVAFLSLFILEGIGSEFGWQDSLAHAILALIFLGVVILCWKKPLLGSWLLIIPGLIYIIQVMINGHAQWTYIGLIPVITGAMFLIDERNTRK